MLLSVRDGRTGMAIGDVETVEAVPDTHYVDTGMYDTAEYGAVYVIDADRPALVEAGIGADRERVLAGIEAVGLDPGEIEVVALTHVHLDHAGGAGFLATDCPGATVFVHEIGAPHLVDPTRLWEGTKAAVGGQIEYYVEPKPVPEERVEGIEDGEAIDLGDRTLRAHHAPGHAPHQVVFHDPANDAVFTADAAGIYAPSRDELFPTSPPPNFDPRQCQSDVDTLKEIQPDVLCYAHFGPVETGDKLARYADVLAEWVADVREARADLDDDAAVVEHFVEQADDERAVWGAEKADAEVAMNVRGVLAALDRE